MNFGEYYVDISEFGFRIGRFFMNFVNLREFCFHNLPNFGESLKLSANLDASYGP